MTVTELIIELSQLPQDLTVVFNATKEGDEFFKFEIIGDVAAVRTDTGEEFALINPPDSVAMKN